jgi:hypothetical protein
MHTVCVLGRAGSEALLTDQRRRLVTKTASDPHALEGTPCESTVRVCAGRRNNFGQSELIAVKVEEAKKLVVILTGVEIHEHGS